MKIDHILIATDLSASARLCHGHAVAFARAFGARLTLLHVDEIGEYGFHSSQELSDYVDRIAVLRAARVERAAEDLAELGAEPEVATRSGTPSQEVLAHAEAEGVDLIVMTKHGARQRHHLLLGSTTKRVVRHAGVPVLVVSGAGAEEEGDVPASELPDYGRIAAACDFSEASVQGFETTVALAESFGAQVDLIHVLRLPTIVTAMPGETPAYPARTMENLRAVYAKEGSDLVARGGRGRAVSHILSGADVAEALLQGAGEQGAGLITIPSRGRGALREVLFGSTSERVLKLSDLPVLVLPH